MDILEVKPSAHLLHTGILRFHNLEIPCALGRSGTVFLKREGDGGTPLGYFRLLSVYYRADKGPKPRTLLPVHAIRRQDGWCDDPHHRLYNKRITLPFTASHEQLWRSDSLYDIVVVLDYNILPAVKGRGSAVFFHLARKGYQPTEGCVAIHRKHMHLLLSKLSSNSVMHISRN